MHSRSRSATAFAPGTCSACSATPVTPIPPTLHFHIMDGPSPLLSNGLSYVFTNFTGRGVVTDEVKINPPFAPQAATIPVDTATLAGPHTKQLPLNLEVVDFP